LPETNSYSYPSSSTYNYPTTTSSSSDYDYEKFKRDLEIEIERAKNRAKSEYYWLKTPSYTPSSSSSYYNSTSNLREYDLNSTYETVTTVSKSIRSSINYHDRYSWGDKLILEKALDKLGYSVGSIDGYIDESTIDAIKEFQGDNGLNTDGKAGDVTVKKMALRLRE